MEKNQAARLPSPPPTYAIPNFLPLPCEAAIYQRRLESYLPPAGVPGRGRGRGQPWTTIAALRRRATRCSRDRLQGPQWRAPLRRMRLRRERPNMGSHRRWQRAKKEIMCRCISGCCLLQGGSMEGFFNLISYFQTQSEPAFCGLAALSVILNALVIDPASPWKGPWRWFDESMLDRCEPLHKVNSEVTPAPGSSPSASTRSPSRTSTPTLVDAPPRMTAISYPPTTGALSSS